MAFVTALTDGILSACLPINLLAMASGLMVGLLTGIIPGISAANGIALLIPVSHAFNFSPVTALILYSGVYYGSKYGGRISSILIDTPGDVSSVSTRRDGYPLALSGQGRKALEATALSSFFASIAAIVVLAAITPFFRQVGNKFGPGEYVALISFVFSLMLLLSAMNTSKTLISLFLGLVLSTVGLDWATGALRFTFNVPELFDGIDFIVVVIGVFALSEAFMMMSSKSELKIPCEVGEKKDFILADGWKHRWTFVRSAVIGCFIGILPGTGSFVANIAAYRIERRIASDKKQFGRGDIRGIIAPEAANSASAIGSFVPLLALGIPGSATTAVLLGALLMMNVNPGEAGFHNHPGLVWALICSMFLGNWVLLFINLKFIRFFPKLLLTPKWILMPIIVVVSFVSVYAVQSSFVSLILMLCIGLLAYGMRVYRYPLAPLVLGYVLGKPVEDNFRIALSISGGDYAVFMSGWTCLLLWIAVLGIIFAILIMKAYRVKLE